MNRNNSIRAGLIIFEPILDNIYSFGTSEKTDRTEWVMTLITQANILIGKWFVLGSDKGIETYKFENYDFFLGDDDRISSFNFENHDIIIVDISGFSIEKHSNALQNLLGSFDSKLLFIYEDGSLIGHYDNQLINGLVKFAYPAIKTPITSKKFSLNLKEETERRINKSIQRYNDNTFELELTIPENLSDEDAKNYAKELVIQLDDTHRALGGSGLKLDDLEAIKIYSSEKIDA